MFGVRGCRPWHAVSAVLLAALLIAVSVVYQNNQGMADASTWQSMARLGPGRRAAQAVPAQARHAAPHQMPAGPALDFDFDWTIFITPQGFEGAADRRQRRAILSWLKLEPRPNIVLVGQGAGYEEVAREYGLKIYPHLDMNFIMMPLAGSLIDFAMRTDTDVSVILNSDVILTQSLPNAIAKLRGQFDSWFLAGARYDLETLPSVFEPDSQEYEEHAFVEFTRTKGTFHTAGGQDYFVWNNDGRPLIHGVMPPFIRGKSKFDNWLVHEVIQGGYREVIDGSESIVAVHVLHDYSDAQGQVAKVDQRKATFWMKQKTSNWQIFHNNNLAVSYGSYRNQDGTTRHAPFKLVSCMEPTGMCLMRRLRPGICPCEHSAFVYNTQNDPEVVTVKEQGIEKRLVRCGAVSPDNRDRYNIPVQTKEGHDPVYGLPFTLTDLLPLVARNNHVVVTGVSYTYRDVVMNFVCNLRRLGIYDQLIIAAFDEDMYRFGFQMGLPVFYYQSDDLAGLSARDMEYGSHHFKKVTKLKSQVVLRILKLGYDVTWTDTDIVWFQNPIPLLADMKSDFVVQSNAPWPDEQAANGPLRINSGFYRVRSTPLAITAMERIVNHAAESTMTEQPSFYIILCGGKEGDNVLGADKCIFKDDDHPGQLLEVDYLDRRKYPNGAVGGFWDETNIAERHPDIVILHNNWIKGIRSKIERIIDHHFWFYNRDKEICDYSDKPTFKFDWVVEDYSDE